MIPFFQSNTILIGPLTIQVWGLMVSLGIIAGVLVMTRLAKKFFLSQEVVLDLAMWSIVGGFLGARLFHVIFYHLDYYLLHPSEVLKFWHGGASSLGGFFGAVVAVWVFAKCRHFTWAELFPYFDIGSVSFWLSWGIGRIGCFLIHDHPGTLSHFMLSVQFPAGARHDLGLYDSILGFALFGIFILLFKRFIKTGWGFVAGYSWIAYAVARFFLDFFRATDLAQSDVRYGHLTPAQWGMITLVIALTTILIFVKVKQPKENNGIK